MPVMQSWDDLCPHRLASMLARVTGAASTCSFVRSTQVSGLLFSFCILGPLSLTYTLAIPTVNHHRRPSLLLEARTNLGDPPLVYTVISNCHHIDTAAKIQTPCAADCFGYDVEHNYRTTNNPGYPPQVEASNLNPQPRTCLLHITSGHSQPRRNFVPNPNLNQQPPSLQTQHVLVKRLSRAASNVARKNDRRDPHQADLPKPCCPLSKRKEIHCSAHSHPEQFANSAVPPTGFL
jgi:hypothetical protein